MSAIVPGTFDPITLGHLDIIQRAAEQFKEVVVAVAQSDAKQPWFTVQERVAMVRETCAGLPEVRVDSFDGLLVKYAQQQRCRVIVKGLRAVSDFEYELQMAHTNRQLAPDIETFFMMTSARYSYLSSRIVRELALLGGEISELVPANVVEPLRSRAALAREGHHRSS